MNQRRIGIFGLMLGMAALTTASAARGQAASPGSASPTHIAVVNLKEVYSKLAETKEVQTKLTRMNEDLTSMQASHKAQIEDFQRQISNVKVESTQHDEMMAKLDDMQLDFKKQETLQQVKMVREQNHQIIHAFTVVQATVAEIAKKRGFDLVLVNNDTEVPTNAGDIANQETVANLVFNHNVLYAGDKVNITADVTAAVDADDKSKATAGPAEGH